MAYPEELQRVLDAVDERITERLTVTELAGIANISPWHFCRVFQAVTGLPVMAYVTRRKLEFAAAALGRGKKVIDAAMEYGFETHAGFTKAFKRCFGCPPSLYRLRAGAGAPQRVCLAATKKTLSGGMTMQPQIRNLEPFTIIGYEHRYALPDVRRTGDIPAWWDSVNMEFSKPLSRLHHTFTASKHCEYGICYDVDLETGDFTYMLGVGVDNNADKSKIEPDMQRMDLPGGLYAVFTTPLVPDAQYAASIREMWKRIILDWLPDSMYEFDEERRDFEYYDPRDHAWEHDGMVQMDICIPVKTRR